MAFNKNQVFLVDDDQGARRTLEIILSRKGYEIKTFGRGEDIHQFFKQHPKDSAPAAALVDLWLPDMDGVKVMRKIKEVSGETEVVMLTGNPDMSSAIDSINAGAYAYFLKPYNIGEIENVLEKIFERQKLVRENRELTEKLKKWNEKLEDEVYQRTVALQESYKKLEMLYQMRTQFVSVMSHELRTPITALMGYADTLREKWKKLSDKKIQDYLDIIYNESSRMTSLMSEIFELSRIHEGKLELSFEKCDLIALVKDVVNEFRSRYRNCSFGFNERSSPLPCYVDPVYFKNAVSHVLVNAVKYTPNGGHILILTQKENDTLFLRIEDSGPGVPKDLWGKVFEPFFRSMDNVNRKIPGAGLGLTIAQGIIQALNGSIATAEKKTGGVGCAVVITIPSSDAESS